MVRTKTGANPLAEALHSLLRRYIAQNWLMRAIVCEFFSASLQQAFTLQLRRDPLSFVIPALALSYPNTPVNAQNLLPLLAGIVRKEPDCETIGVNSVLTLVPHFHSLSFNGTKLP